MGFLRQNLFYVVLIAAVSVGGGGMGFAYLGWSGQWEEKLNEREKADRELNNQSKMVAVNPESVRIEKRRVETIRKAAADIAARSADWNRRAVLQIPGIDEEGNAVKVAAFPFKGEVKGSTRFDFTQEYIKEVQAFLRKLDATRPPTQDEINDQINKASQRIELRRILAARQSGTETPDVPTGRRTRDPAGGPESIEAQAKEEGMATALVSRANGGAVYATLQSFDSYFGTALPSATDTELWEAQLNLWVQQDLVEAIGKTNQVAHDRSPHKDKKLRVPNAAIKRLVQINVAKEYFAGGAGATGGSRSSRETLGGYDEWEGRRRDDREGRRGRTEERRYEEPLIDAGAEVGEAANLTQRITYQDFDVIHYSFTVIMPLRYLVLLEEQLQRLPYHTV
ncbi:MAG: hypothetical protein KAX78_05895, partial [Phycisphaerae bacterium]|nr:hypothetical protein [Phycisphaerae bacterium]